jgi:hypothetical protein
MPPFIPTERLFWWTLDESEADLSITAVMELLMESRSLSLADEAVCFKYTSTFVVV